MSQGTTKADQIALVIEEEILTGQLPPGTILRQDSLSERFSVSRTPVREALRQLAALGVVDFVPNRGVRIRRLSHPELHEAFVIRAELEGLAAEAAAARISPPEIEALREAEETFATLTHRVLGAGAREDADSELLVDWVQANHAFHDVILRSAQMPLLHRLAVSVRRVFHGQAVWARGADIRRRYEENLREHRLIREAIEVGSTRGARALMIDHVLASGTLLDAVLGALEDEATVAGGETPAANVQP